MNIHYLLLMIMMLLGTFQVNSSGVKVQTVNATISCEVTNYIKSSTILNLQFSTNLSTITSISDISGAIDIKLKSLSNGTDFMWTVKSKVNDSLFKIEMTYYTSIYVKSLYLYFINPYAIKTASNEYLSLDSYSISVDVGPVVLYSSSETTEYETMGLILVISMIAFSALYLILYTFRVLKEGLSLFWAWVDLIQLYNLFLFIDTHHFENVGYLLRQCSYLNFWSSDFINTYKSYSFLANIQEGSTEDAITNLPYRFIVESYQTFFLQNAFFSLWIIVIGLILLLGSVIICPASRFGVQNILRNLIQFSLPIRGTLITCCSITLSILLYFKNFTGTINIVCCIIIIIYFLFCIIWFIQVLNNGLPTPLNEQDSKDKYGSLYEGLILKAIFKRNFNIFFMFRKIVMAVFVVYLDNKDMFQMIFLLIVQIIYMGLIASKLPYQNSRSNLFMVVSEFFLSMFLLLMSTWIIFDYLGEDFIYFSNRISISWTLHVILLLSIYTRVIGFLFEAQYIYQKEALRAKLEEKQLQNIEQQQQQFDENQQGNGVNQKLLFYHHQLKDNLAQNQNEEVENPDDFQFIEMPDIYELIQRDKEDENEDLKEQQQLIQQQLAEQEKQKNDLGQKEKNNNPNSDDEDEDDGGDGSPKNAN